MFDKKTLEGVRFEEGHKIDDEFFYISGDFKKPKKLWSLMSLYIGIE